MGHRAAQGTWIAALGAVCALAVLDIVVAYELGWIAAVVIPIAAIGAVGVWKAPTLGVCAGILAVPLEAVGLSLGGFAAISVAEACFVGTAAVVAAHFVIEGGWRPLHGVHTAFAALLLTIALGYAIAEDQGTLIKILLMWSAFLLVSMLVAQSGPKDLQRVLLSLGASAGVVGAVAVLGAGDQELVSGGAIATGRAQGTFDQPNLLGFFLALTIPVAVVMASRGPWLQKTAMLGAAGVASAGLALTLSRTSIVGTLLAFLVLLSSRPIRRLAVVGLAAMTIFALFNAGALLQSDQFQVVGKRLGTLSSQGIKGDEGRYELYTRTPEIILDNPFVGVGEGNFSVAAASYRILDPDGLPFDHAHNVPLTIAAETGLVGLAALTAFAALLFGAARQALRQRTAPLWPLALASVAALCATTVTSIGDYPPRSNVIMATIMVHVGVIVACARSAAALEPQGPRDPTPPRPWPAR